MLDKKEEKDKTFLAFPFVVSFYSLWDKEGFSPIGLEFYRGKESGKWTISFVLLDFNILISIL